MAYLISWPIFATAKLFINMYWPCLSASPLHLLESVPNRSNRHHMFSNSISYSEARRKKIKYRVICFSHRKVKHARVECTMVFVSGVVHRRITLPTPAAHTRTGRCTVGSLRCAGKNVNQYVYFNGIMSFVSDLEIME
jgi:hypothetical protein